MRIKKSGCYFLFCLLEILVFLLFAGKTAKEDTVGHLFRDYFREDTGEGSDDGTQGTGKIYTEEIVLSKGIYDITLLYEKGKGRAVSYVQCMTASAGARALYSDHVSLSDRQEGRTFSVYVNENNVSVRVVVEPDSPEAFNVNWITLSTADNSRAYRIFCMAVKLLLFNIIAYVIYFRERKFKWAPEVTGIIIIGGIASLGLMEEYILYGHDLIFHLFRIEGLAEGLKAGSFPVRIQPGWFNGWGYPVSVMYGEGLLLFPSVLRILGVSVQNAYKCYIAAINLGTAAAAYYAFLKMSGEKKNALFGSCIYTLFPYRLSCIYVRAALGEYSAMLFLPLAALGFYYAFEKIRDSRDDDGGAGSGYLSKRHLIAPVIGFTGLIQTHVIICFLAAFAIFLFCAVSWKKMLNKRRLVYFAEIGVFTILINLWFLVPFFRYMQEDFVVNLRHGMEPVFQNYGASLAELFAVYWNGTLTTTWSAIGPLSDKFPKPVGTAIWALLAAAVLMHYKGGLRCRKKEIALTGGFFVLFALMASSVFPYREIDRMIPAFGNLFGKIQFPFRLLTLAGLFGSLLGVFVIMEIQRNYGRGKGKIVMMFLGFLAMMQGAQLIYSTLYRGDMYLAYDIAAFESNAVSDGEYLYPGSFGPAVEDIQTPVSAEEGGVDIRGFEKEYNTVTVICKTENREAGLLIPLYYYPGYTARDLNTGERFAVEKSGENNQICVILPAGYEGSLQVRFEEPVSWRLAEAVSGICVMLLLAAFIGFLKRKTVA